MDRVLNILGGVVAGYAQMIAIGIVVALSPISPSDLMTLSDCAMAPKVEQSAFCFAVTVLLVGAYDFLHSLPVALVLCVAAVAAQSFFPTRGQRVLFLFGYFATVLVASSIGGGAELSSLYYIFSLFQYSALPILYVLVFAVARRTLNKPMQPSAKASAD